MKRLNFWSPKPRFLHKQLLIIDEENNDIESAPHPRQIVKIPVEKGVSLELLRREKPNGISL